MHKDTNGLSPKERRTIRERKIRRDSIVGVAEKFFLDQGYDDARVDEIAQAAGYTKATLYNYFDTKDDLFIAVISRLFERMHQTFKEEMRRPGVEYELRFLGEAYLTFVHIYPDQSALFDYPRLSLVLGKILQKEETGEELTESEQEFRQHQLHIQELMMSVITATMEKSGVQSKVEPMSVIMALSTLNSSIREIIMRGRRTGQPEEQTQEQLDVLFTIIDKGLKHYDK